MQSQYQSLTELAAAVEAQDAAKADYIAPTRELTLRDNGNRLAIGEQGDDFEVNAHCHRQIGSRLGIPAKYYDRMRANAPDLLAENVNTWFSREPEDQRRMVRTLDGTARAFLSDRYQRIDNIDICRAVFPVLAEIGKEHPVALRSCALTEQHLHIKLTVPTITGEVKVGDKVEAGFEWRNGEIGNSMFEGSPFVYRLICLNGMTVPEGGFKKMHVGARADIHEDAYKMLSDETLKADDEVLMLKARDIVKWTLNEENFDKILGRFREAAGEKIEGNPAEAIELLANKNSLTDGEKGSVLRHLIEDGDLSKWGVANAVTRSAQDAEEYERADELMKLGGKLIDLPATQWNELKIAA